MTSTLAAEPRYRLVPRSTPAPFVIAGLAFVVLFWEPLATLARDWWTFPEAAHGLLLAPLALYLAWRAGFTATSTPQPAAGIGLLIAAVCLRYLSGLAAELFTMRLSMLGAIVALVVWSRGVGQVRQWWLPLTLILLSVPIPVVVLGSVALPLQLEASRMGAAMLVWRHVPVEITGNILNLPGRSLFVTEACSGLRSLTALLALGVLIGGLWLRSGWARVALLLVAVPVAMAVNGVRVFLTGYLMYWVSPRLGEGFMHYTQGWALFVAAFLALGATAWGLSLLEQRGAST